ncbi:MAG: sulfotransferase, partial [Chloroflexota bacterium]|nr:sulfotransferase [Chloroflexota bacterium]
MAIILTGHHRSGTSILALLCNSHPDMTITNEFGNFLALGEPTATYSRFMLAHWWNKRNVPFALSQRYTNRIRGMYMLQNLIFITRYLYAVRRQGKARVAASTVDAALRSLAPHKRVVGDKHPDYAFKLDQFANVDAVRCLFIYRDPRDLASS